MKKIILILTALIVLSGCDYEIAEKSEGYEGGYILVETKLSVFKAFISEHKDELIKVKTSEPFVVHTDYYFFEDSLPVFREDQRIPEGPFYYIYVAM